MPAPKTVADWKSEWLPPSETVIRDQTAALSRWRPLKVAWTRVAGGTDRTMHSQVWRAGMAARRQLRSARSAVRRLAGRRARHGQPLRGTGLSILFVESSLGEDGAARSNVRLADRWGAACGNVSLYVLQGFRPDRIPVYLPPGVEPLYPTARRLRRRWIVTLGALKMVPLALRADVVVSGREVGWGLLVARLVSWLTRRPFVAMIRSEPGSAIDHHVSPRLRPMSRSSLRTADRIICISSGLVPAVRDLGVEPDRISVVLNGVEVGQIRSAADAPRPDVPGDAGVLLVGVGRLERQKGFDLLIRAHARVVRSGLPHDLLLLGEGGERDALAALADTLGVSDSVHMPGFSPAPLPVVRSADLFCLPSRWEGFGQSLAEALILGTPVVAADCVSGPREILHDGAFGDLVPVEDSDALAAAIEAHLRAPERLRAAALAGQAWAVVQLDVDRTAKEMLEVLQEVTASW